MNLFPHFCIVLIIICNCIISNLGKEEENGYCEDGDDNSCDERHHNTWVADGEESVSSRKSLAADDIIGTYLKDNGVSLTRLELVLLLNHLDLGDDGRVDKGDLEAVQALEGDTIKIVQSVLTSFNRLDKNDDGKLTRDELPPWSKDEEEQDDEVTVTISKYLEIVANLHSSVAEAVEPFYGLEFLSPFEVKTVIGKSVAIFLDKDVDHSGGLNMDEYLSQVDRPDNLRAQMLDQTQKESIFKMIDKNGDKEISFGEFQSVIPKGPPTVPSGKDLESLFKGADKDGDGFWSNEEFSDHLKNMVAATGAPPPQKQDMAEAFAQLDKDQDGRVSKDEMQGIQKQIEKIQTDKAVQGFMDMDTNSDGVLSKEELATMANFMEEQSGQKVDVDMLIKMMDRNGNDVIELEELKEMVQRMVPQTKNI